ncbi:hypothetical protein BOTBODRAFT_185207 [Botryobasidium botryosum FD-172 SS1]|uniref:Uncharacterized protein n=1 Tax=Botryobasidium botryosum (strain FD-172 SS1) TaxID=930990 RepID=A0A067MSU3_BOTB1|nr:hypothetical protein BOTBODRAFT_185207 [Botryobasidium botryosum FD-172 SS1]
MSALVLPAHGLPSPPALSSSNASSASESDAQSTPRNYKISFCELNESIDEAGEPRIRGPRPILRRHSLSAYLPRIDELLYAVMDSRKEKASDLKGPFAYTPIYNVSVEGSTSPQPHHSFISDPQPGVTKALATRNRSSSPEEENNSSRQSRHKRRKIYESALGSSPKETKWIHHYCEDPSSDCTSHSDDAASSENHHTLSDLSSSPVSESSDFDTSPEKSSTSSTTASSPISPHIPIAALVSSYSSEHPSIIPYGSLSRSADAQARIKNLLVKEKRYRISDGLDKNLYLGRDSNSEFRADVVEWLLSTLPDQSVRDYKPLHDHLTTSTETRYHAVTLFTRYCFRIGEYGPLAEIENASDTTLSEREKRKLAYFEKIRRRVLWDMATGCLSIAVKFHHDFLPPLLPIFANDIVSMARLSVTPEELLEAEADVLQCFDYQVHDVTPHVYFNELYEALPSLRRLLSFQNGWYTVKVRTWDILEKAVFENDMLMYPTSHVTAAALAVSIADALKEEFGREAFSQRLLDSEAHKRRPGRRASDKKAELENPEDADDEADDEDEELDEVSPDDNKSTYAFSARRASATVVEEIKTLLEVSESDFRRCREWLARMGCA